MKIKNKIKHAYRQLLANGPLMDKRYRCGGQRFFCLVSLGNVTELFGIFLRYNRVFIHCVREKSNKK